MRRAAEWGAWTRPTSCTACAATPRLSPPASTASSTCARARRPPCAPSPTQDSQRGRDDVPSLVSESTRAGPAAASCSLQGGGAGRRRTVKERNGNGCGTTAEQRTRVDRRGRRPPRTPPAAAPRTAAAGCTCRVRARVGRTARPRERGGRLRGVAADRVQSQGPAICPALLERPRSSPPPPQPLSCGPRRWPRLEGGAGDGGGPAAHSSHTTTAPASTHPQAHSRRVPPPSAGAIARGRPFQRGRRGVFGPTPSRGARRRCEDSRTGGRQTGPGEPRRRQRRPPRLPWPPPAAAATGKWRSGDKRCRGGSVARNSQRAHHAPCSPRGTAPST